MNAGDLNSLVALYEPDGLLAQQDGSFAAGHAAIRARLAPFLEARPTIRMHVVRVARAGDTAVLYNAWSLTVTSPDGSAVEMRGKALDDPYARD